MTSFVSDAELRDILATTRTIACVGVSINPVRPSYFVARYLGYRGYRVIPVNPGQAGKTLFKEEIRATLEDIPKDAGVDMLDLFRRSEHVLPIVKDAIATLPDLKTVWMQIGVENEEAADLARAHGLRVVQNRCPKIEYQRLFGELRKAGFNTRIITSRLDPNLG